MPVRLISLTVKGDRFIAVKAALERGLRHVEARQLPRPGIPAAVPWTTLVVTEDQAQKVMDWFHESAGQPAPLPIGTVLVWSYREAETDQKPCARCGRALADCDCTDPQLEGGL